MPEDVDLVRQLESNSTGAVTDIASLLNSIEYRAKVGHVKPIKRWGSTVSNSVHNVSQSIYTHFEETTHS